MAITSILLPIFLAIGLGALSVYAKVFKAEDSRIFSRYDYFFGFPVYIFYALAITDFYKISDAKFLLVNVANLAVTAAIIILLFLILRVEKKFIGVAVLAGLFGNVAYMGVPINEMLLGKESAGFTSVVIGLVSLFCLSVGIFFLEYFANEKPDLKKIILNLFHSPIIIAVLAGAAVSAMNLHFPDFLANFFTLVGKSASPIALFAIGMFIAGNHLFKNKSKIAILCFLNLTLLPLVTYALSRYFGLDGVPMKVSLLEAAMPIGITNFVIAQQHKASEDLVAGAIVVSTLISIVTIAGWIFALPYLGG